MRAICAAEKCSVKDRQKYGKEVGKKDIPRLFPDFCTCLSRRERRGKTDFSRAFARGKIRGDARCTPRPSA